MSFLILAETSAGYALFKAKDKKLLKKDDLAKEMSTPEGAAGLFVFLQPVPPAPVGVWRARIELWID